jgi:iron(III) transport system ATP-binding protein
VTALTLEGLTKTFQRAGTVVDSIDLRIENGEFFTLLGPSGCGKSTILRMIAGFENPTNGRILFDNRDMTSHPPNQRNVGFVFQNYALFPHLTVAGNVAFGLEVRKQVSADVQRRVDSALKQVQLGGIGAARVDQLSGGQQQRVALARALVIEPKLLLLDEPLSNLDAKLREETRAMLRALHTASRVTTIYVTHDQTEAMGMSDRVAVLNRGKIQQLGKPEEIYERPANRFVADFIGRNNVLDATVVRVTERALVIHFANGTELSVESGQKADGLIPKPGSAVGVCIRAEALTVTSGQGPFSGVVTDIEYGGAVRSCKVATDVGELRVEVPGSDLMVKGESVRLNIGENAIHLVDGKDEV